MERPMIINNGRLYYSIMKVAPCVYLVGVDPDSARHACLAAHHSRATCVAFSFLREEGGGNKYIVSLFLFLSLWHILVLSDHIEGFFACQVIY